MAEGTVAQPDPRADDSFARSLPLVLSPIVGRHAEVRRVRDLLADPGTRVVTLAGPGGVGKTRIAQEVSARSRAPVLWVPLAPVADLVGVLPAMARAAGWSLDDRPPLDVVGDGLDVGPALLVLDTAEHLGGLADVLVEVTRRCPRLRVLVTSRVALGVPAEQVVEIDLLPVPEHGRDVDEVSAMDSVALLVQTACRDAPGFAVTDANREAVVDICRRLDGLPLALELGAARLRLLAPAQLAAMLDQPLAVLGNRTDRRHLQSLRATIDWSFRLLPAEDQRRFSRLGVFPGTFGLAAAAAVAEVPVTDLLDTFDTLLDHHLLRPVRAEHAEEPRFELLDTLRAYARERLVEAGGVEEARRRHAAWVAGLAAECGPRLDGPASGTALSRLDVDHDNLEAALGCLSEDAEAGDPEAVGTLLELVGRLARYWWLRGRRAEGIAWTERALAAAGDRRTDAHAHARLGAGLLSDQHDVAAAERHYTAAAELFSALGEGTGAADAWMGLASVARSRGHTADAEPLLRRALDAVRAAGDRRKEASCLHGLAACAYYAGDLAGAERLWTETDALLQEAGDERARGIIVANLGSVRVALGDPQAAVTAFDAAAEIAERHADRYGLVSATVNAVEARVLAGDLTGIDDRVARATRLARECDDHYAIATIVAHAGLLALRRGRLGEAAAQYAEAWRRFVDLDFSSDQAETLERLAIVADELDCHDLAAPLLDRAAAIRRESGSPATGSLAEEVQRCAEQLSERLDRPVPSPSTETLTDGELSEQVRAFVRRVRGVHRGAQPSGAAASTFDLTPRQREIAQLLALRLTDQEIADRLVVSRRTVTTHVSAVLRTLGVSSRREVAAVIHPPPPPDEERRGPATY